MLYIALYDMVGNEMKKAWQLFLKDHILLCFGTTMADMLIIFYESKLTSALYCKKIYSKGKTFF